MIPSTGSMTLSHTAERGHGRTREGPQGSGRIGSRSGRVLREAEGSDQGAAGLPGEKEGWLEKQGDWTGEQRHLQGRGGCPAQCSRLSPFRPSWRSAYPACPSAHRTVRHFAGLFCWDRSTSRYWGEGETRESRRALARPSPVPAASLSPDSPCPGLLWRSWAGPGAVPGCRSCSHAGTPLEHGTEGTPQPQATVDAPHRNTPRRWGVRTPPHETHSVH